jgi:predicted Zn-dependent protease
MVGKERALAACAAAVAARAGAEQLEAVLMADESYLTRFATNHIHQNVGESNAVLTVRAAIGQRVGAAATNRLDREGILEAVNRAEAIARVQRDNPYWRSMPAPPVAAAGAAHDAVDGETAAFGPEDRARGVADIVAAASKAGLSAAGSYSTHLLEVAVVNSLGASTYAAGTSARVSAVIAGDTGSGYADATAGSVSCVDPAAAGCLAVRKALASADPQALPAGEYTVILEPRAVADMLQFLAFLGFGAKAAQEGRSFMAGRIGQPVLGPNITLWDDGQDPAGLPVPFDFEGVPRQKVMLVEGGVAKGLVHDSLTAGREGRASTGHALPPGMTYGPLPLNLFMAPGDSSLEEMIASTERGILVTRLHYVNPVHPLRVIITGMTRDGTFLVENGRIARPVRNLRFTESVLRALSDVDALSREREFKGGYFGGAVVPAIRVRRFAFTGTTEF